MSTQKPPMTPIDHIARAKQELAAGAHRDANSHALVAIAELLAIETVARIGQQTVNTIAAALNVTLGGDQ